MIDQETGLTRTILAYTLYPNHGSGGLLGCIKPLVEIVDDRIIELTPETFCQTMKVFITGQYDELDKKFPNHEIFKIDVSPSKTKSENVDPAFACKYVSHFKMAEQIKPKEFFEIIKSELPDPNNRIVNIDRTYPGTKHIFIDDGVSIFGPLNWAPAGTADPAIKIEFIDGPLTNGKLAPFQIFKIDRESTKLQILEARDSGRSRFITQDLNIAIGASFHDYASDAEIVRFCSKLASENNIKVIEKSKIDSLATLLTKIPKLKTLAVVRHRLAKLPELAAEASDFQDEVIDNFTKFLNGENGKTIVLRHIERNEAHFLEALKKDKEIELNAALESKRDEIKIAEARLKELNDNKVSLSIQVEEIRKATKQEAVLDTARAEADIQLNNKKQEIKTLETILSEKQILVDGLLTLESIKREIGDLDRNRKNQWVAEREMKGTISALETELARSDDELRKRLTELKPFVEAINGSFAPIDTAQKDISVKTHEIKSNEPFVSRQRAVLEEIQARLVARGRHLKDWQIANILISTQQSFITFFAGLPGVGKTSLARLIADLQGIKPRMQEISVARGWTSQKDLIGFFNPLTSRFQPSNTGLHAFLLALAREKNDSTQAMAYVLLDEANLSSIEHYWSSFMGMTDGEGDRALTLGQERVNIPDCLRFISTINYDGTTEPLSPRIVDRAPIIVIEPGELGALSSDERLDINLHQLPISLRQMRDLFGKEENTPELENSEKSTLEKIRKTLLDKDTSLGRSVSISPRKEIAISQYCNKARGVMNAETEFLALDVAILQHILPLVRGTGPRFGQRLKKLKQVLEDSNLPKSSEFVERMIFTGEIDLNTYDFFCW